MTLADAPPLQLMPELDSATLAALRDSIKRFGVLVPIAVTPYGDIIDGHNRWAIAQELDVPCEARVYEVESADEATELARSLNMDRRHLDAPTRAALARSLREQGHSLRAIAGALGVAPNTVRSDLGDVPTVQDCTVGTSEPDTIVGLDGKTRPATRRGPWTPEELYELLDRVESGAAQRDLCAEHGLTLNNLRHLLTRARKLRKGEVEPPSPKYVAEKVRVEQISVAARQGLSSRQIAEQLGIGAAHVRDIARRNAVDIPADAVVGRAPNINSRKVAEETVSTLEGVAASLRLVDPADLDPSDCQEWVTSLSESLRVLTRFRNHLKEMTRESE